jgi:hypothetical protein
VTRPPGLRRRRPDSALDILSTSVCSAARVVFSAFHRFAHLGVSLPNGYAFDLHVHHVFRYLAAERQIEHRSFDHAVELDTPDDNRLDRMTS